MPALQDFASVLADQIGKEHAAMFLDHVSLQELPRGEVLLRDQASVSALYLLIEGRVGLSVEVAGHAIHLGTMDAGNWIGEVAYFSGSHISCSTVTAETDVRLMRLGFAEFGAIARATPEAACRLTHVLVTMLIHRLRATVHNPVVDADGQLFMLGNLSLPSPARAAHERGVIDFFRKLLGTH
ncbi:MAG: cyclic nucleotide-binding domain-containing protein [Hydrogenophilales bacterium]|nr:cyclic nucleotide-binding domain-containing protein [Hydrogenophilales bacterium]